MNGVDQRVLDAYRDWCGEQSGRGILDHRFDVYCLDGLTVEQAMRKVLAEEGIEVPS